jgi:hypothetical protein
MRRAVRDMQGVGLWRHGERMVDYDIARYRGAPWGGSETWLLSDRALYMARIAAPQVGRIPVEGITALKVDRVGHTVNYRIYLAIPAQGWEQYPPRQPGDQFGLIPFNGEPATNTWWIDWSVPYARPSFAKSMKAQWPADSPLVES